MADPTNTPNTDTTTHESSITSLLTVATNLAKPGSQTSEFKLTAFFTVATTIIGALAPFAADLAKDFPNSHAIAIAVTVLSLLASLISVIGYTNGRVNLKLSNLGAVVQEITQLHQQIADLKAPPKVATDAAKSAGDITGSPAKPIETLS